VCVSVRERERARESVCTDIDTKHRVTVPVKDIKTKTRTEKETN
jgi:hypothetical protein